MFKILRRSRIKLIQRSARAAKKIGGGGGSILLSARCAPAFNEWLKCFQTRLLRDMQQASRKLVVFSDSRQDAAKLSAGMRFAHYRDAVRQALTAALETAGRGAMIYQRLREGAPLTPDEQRLAQEFAATHPNERAILADARDSVMAIQPAPGFPGFTNFEAAQQILQRGVHGPFPITRLREDISARLLMQGINPGGFTQSVLWSDPQKREGLWRRLYGWPMANQPDSQPAPRVNPPFAPDEQDHLQRIRETAFREFTDAIFASGRRSLEALGLGLATTDRLRFQTRELVQQAADGVIQLLGSRRNRLSTHGAMPQTNWPTYVTHYLQNVATHNRESPPDFEREVLDLLYRAEVCRPADTGVLFAANLCLVRPAENCYACPQCRRLHLHRAGGLCIECLVPFRDEDIFPVANMPVADDYYRFLALHSQRTIPPELRRIDGPDQQDGSTAPTASFPRSLSAPSRRRTAHG